MSAWALALLVFCALFAISLSIAFIVDSLRAIYEARRRA